MTHMTTLITGLTIFALGLGAGVLILLWHKHILRRRTQEFKNDRDMWKARQSD
jgi:hypothetical protein